MSYLGLLSLLEESLLTSLVLGLLGGEVLGLRDLLNLLVVETGKLNLVGGGDDISGVDSSQGDTVDLEGAGDEEDTLVEGLQEDDTLATEAAGEEDKNSAGLEGLARSPRSDGLADLFNSLVSATHAIIRTVIILIWRWRGERIASPVSSVRCFANC